MLAVPVLIYLLGQSVHAATAESLLVVVGAAAAGAIGHARHGTVCWQLAGAFAAAAIPGSIVGTVANRAVSAEPLLSAFAILLLAVAIVTWRRAGARAGVGDELCPPLRLAWSRVSACRSACSRASSASVEGSPSCRRSLSAYACPCDAPSQRASSS